jgi:hypothetical protein
MWITFFGGFKISPYLCGTKDKNGDRSKSEHKKQMVKMTRQEAATIMTQTFPLAKTWWMSAKHEKAWKQFLEAKKIYKEWIEKKN